MVNKDNANHVLIATLIKDCLAEVGIKITIEAHPFTNYQHKIKTGSNDFYFAETDLLPNFDTKDMQMLIDSNTSEKTPAVIGLCFRNTHLLCDTRIDASDIKTLNPYMSICHWSAEE